VLDRLARATVDDVVAARWLTSAGLPDADLRAAAIAAPDDADDLAADLLITLPDAVVRVVGEVVELAVPLDTDLPGVLGTLAGGRAAGIGIAVRPGALVVSLRQARSALPASRVQGRHVHAEEIASSRLLLNTVGAQPLQAYADAVLGPLDATDRSGELMRGLTAFLEHNGHWGAAATALRVHRHTIRNRIDAVERLTGRRMDSAQDRHELWLALRARDAARMSADYRPRHAEHHLRGTERPRSARPYGVTLDPWWSKADPSACRRWRSKAESRPGPGTMPRPWHVTSGF